MKASQSTTRFRFLVAAFLLSITIVACVPPRLGVSWPAVNKITLNGEDEIVVAYLDHVAIVNPNNGRPVKVEVEGRILEDADGNERVWAFNGGDYQGAQFFANPIMVPEQQSMLLFGHDKKLYDIDLESARVLGSSPLPGSVLADPLVADNRYYVPLETAGIAAVDAEDYQVIWESEAGGVWAKPLLVENRLYYTSMDHHTYAVDAATGEVIWKTDLGGGAVATPVYQDGKLYVGSIAHKVFELSADTGEVLTEFQTQNWVWGTPAIYENILYVADLGGYVYALDLANGLKQLWSVKIATRGIRPGPLVTQEYVIVAARDGKVYWLDRADGVSLFDKEIEGQPEILSDILLLEPSEMLDIPEPMIVVSTPNNSHLLVAFSLETGRENWVYAR